MLAPGTQALFRLELRHAEQMAEHLQPVALRQLDQFGNGLRNEGHGLIGAALLSSVSGTFLGVASPDACLKLFASGRLQLCSKNLHPIEYNIAQK